MRAKSAASKYILQHDRGRVAGADRWTLKW